MMHIACATDEAFLPHMAAMLDSLFAHNDPASVTVHYLHDELLPAIELQRLRGFIEGAGSRLQAHRVTPEKVEQFPDNRRFGKVAWYRVMLPEILPADIKRVLYLDADTLVLDSLQPLWQVDLQGRPVAAVCNPLYEFMDSAFLADLGLSSVREYFNSGVLLLDMDAWRAGGYSRALVDFSQAQGRHQEWPDQNGLNVVFRGQWLPLDPCWNAQNTFFDLKLGHLGLSEKKLHEARNNPKIVHFIGPYKPWHFRCKHGYRQAYWRHLSTTPWSGRKMDGVSFVNRVLRLLPEQWGWHVEIFWLRLRGKRSAPGI